MSNLPTKKMTKNMKKRLEKNLYFSEETLLEGKDIQSYNGFTDNGEFFSNYNGYTNEFRPRQVFRRSFNKV